MTKVEEIYATVLPEMEEHGIEDTLENRYWFLKGLRDGWAEDEDDSIEKSLYMIAISAEIWSLQMKLRFQILR